MCESWSGREKRGLSTTHCTVCVSGSSGSTPEVIVAVNQIINSVETLKRHQCPFPWIPPPGNAKPWDRMCRCAVILKGEAIEPWLITTLMRENWWLTKGRETIWIKTKLPLKGNLIPIAQMQEKGIVWHCKNKHDLSFFSIWTSPGKTGSVLRTAPGTVWHFGPLTVTDGLAAASLHEQSLYHWICVRVKNTEGKEQILVQILARLRPAPFISRTEVLEPWWSLWGHSHLWKTSQPLTYCAKSTASY